jgi:drug/metabolite transporter (DMT)-like permease
VPASQPPPTARIALWVALALTGFAANSLLCRLALAPRGPAPAIDPATFTALRVAAGALVLVLLTGAARARARGGLRGAAALLLYALGFSLAYVRIGAAVGALVLFAAVQATMLGAAIVGGARPGLWTWFGLTAALSGIAWLVAPGLGAPDPLGALLMAGAGVAWGAYSLLGRQSEGDPLGATAGNFLRAAPPALLAVLAAFFLFGQTPALDAYGAALALSSGALASGLGYAIWYTALPHLDPTRAGIVQLLVPVLAAAAAVPLLGEPLTPRLLGAGAIVIGGVAAALLAEPRPRPR